MKGDSRPGLSVRLGMALGLISALGGCALSPRLSLEATSGSVRVVGQSLRPLTDSAAVPWPPNTELNLPGTPPPSEWTVVRAVAQSTPPSEILNPRLARLYAREEARVEAMTRGLRQLIHWQDAHPSRRLTREETSIALASAVRLHEQSDRMHALIFWSPPGSRGEGSTPSTNRANGAPEAPRRLSMEGEARESALAALRETLMSSEVSPGVTLQEWMDRNGVPSRSLDALLARAEVRRTEHRVAPDRSLRICEVVLEFDRRLLRRLR